MNRNVLVGISLILVVASLALVATPIVAYSTSDIIVSVSKEKVGYIKCFARIASRSYEDEISDYAVMNIMNVYVFEKTGGKYLTPTKVAVDFIPSRIVKSLKIGDRVFISDDVYRITVIKAIRTDWGYLYYVTYYYIIVADRILPERKVWIPEPSPEPPSMPIPVESYR